jgi:hypothetical protein
LLGSDSVDFSKEFATRIQWAEFGLWVSFRSRTFCYTEILRKNIVSMEMVLRSAMGVIETTQQREPSYMRFRTPTVNNSDQTYSARNGFYAAFCTGFIWALNILSFSRRAFRKL